MASAHRHAGGVGWRRGLLTGPPNTHSLNDVWISRAQYRPCASYLHMQIIASQNMHIYCWQYTAECYCSHTSHLPPCIYSYHYAMDQSRQTTQIHSITFNKWLNFTLYINLVSMIPWPSCTYSGQSMLSFLRMNIPSLIKNILNVPFVSLQLKPPIGSAKWSFKTTLKTETLHVRLKQPLVNFPLTEPIANPMSKSGQLRYLWYTFSDMAPTTFSLLHMHWQAIWSRTVINDSMHTSTHVKYFFFTFLDILYYNKSKYPMAYMSNNKW